MRVGGAQQVRQRVLRGQERAARVDLVHQVEALDRRVERAGQVDGRGVVDQHVDAAEALDRGLSPPPDLRLVTHVHGHRQRLAAGAPRSRPPRCESCPGSLGCGASVLPVTTTLAPSAAARSPMASPIPRLAPVMKTVRPVKDMCARPARAGTEDCVARCRLSRTRAACEHGSAAMRQPETRVPVLCTHKRPARLEAVRAPVDVEAGRSTRRSCSRSCRTPTCDLACTCCTRTAGRSGIRALPGRCRSSRRSCPSRRW